ncbi:hypothetical protein GCM10009838_29330 [Catenulispora subtropica]|uniref:Uncharacterized protein n=1 Tax=Catenulispora subtropica TaxID=450798 RepID=A0ABP5CU33_9ACTN
MPDRSGAAAAPAAEVTGAAAGAACVAVPDKAEAAMVTPEMMFVHMSSACPGKPVVVIGPKSHDQGVLRYTRNRVCRTIVPSGALQKT